MAALENHQLNRLINLWKYSENFLLFIMLRSKTIDCLHLHHLSKSCLLLRHNVIFYRMKEDLNGIGKQFFWHLYIIESSVGTEAVLFNLETCLKHVIIIDVSFWFFFLIAILLYRPAFEECVTFNSISYFSSVLSQCLFFHFFALIYSMNHILSNCEPQLK